MRRRSRSKMCSQMRSKIVMRSSSRAGEAKRATTRAVGAVPPVRPELRPEDGE